MYEDFIASLRPADIDLLRQIIVTNLEKHYPNLIPEIENNPKRTMEILRFMVMNIPTFKQELLGTLKMIYSMRSKKKSEGAVKKK